jgi:uncharacterized Tic20 family protein
MMNPLSIRVRLLATLCHLSGLTWVAAFAIMIQLQSMTQLQNRLLPLLLGLTISLPILIWIFARRVHDFVDRNGREVVNTILSLLLYSICLFWLFTTWYAKSTFKMPIKQTPISEILKISKSISRTFD